MDNQDITSKDPQQILFVDKVNCIIVEDNNKEASRQIEGQRGPRVIYKPLFFRVQPLQAIQVRQGMKQNIGVNLSQYMSKVREFSISIGNAIYVESARTGIYVIFNIDASKISEASGEYHIMADNEEYVSSGSYTIV